MPRQKKGRVGKRRVDERTKQEHSQTPQLTYPKQGEKSTNKHLQRQKNRTNLSPTRANSEAQNTRVKGEASSRQSGEACFQFEVVFDQLVRNSEVGSVPGISRRAPWRIPEPWRHLPDRERLDQLRHGPSPGDIEVRAYAERARKIEPSYLGSFCSPAIRNDARTPAPSLGWLPPT